MLYSHPERKGQDTFSWLDLGWRLPRRRVRLENGYKLCIAKESIIPITELVDCTAACLACEAYSALWGMQLSTEAHKLDVAQSYLHATLAQQIQMFTTAHARARPHNYPKQRQRAKVLGNTRLSEAASVHSCSTL